MCCVRTNNMSSSSVKGTNGIKWMNIQGIWTRYDINMVAEPGNLPLGVDVLLARLNTMGSRIQGIETAIQDKMDSLQMGMEVSLQKMLGYVEDLADYIPKDDPKKQTEIYKETVKTAGDSDIVSFKLNKIEREETGKDDKTEDEEDNIGVDQFTFAEGVQGKLMMRGLVKKWFVDKGYWFLDVKGFPMFCHADRVVGQDWLRVGGWVWVKVMEDLARGSGSWKVVEAWEQERWEQEKARREAQRAVDLAERASRIALRSVQNGKRMMEKTDDRQAKMEEPPGIVQENHDSSHKQENSFSSPTQEIYVVEVDRAPPIVASQQGSAQQGNAPQGNAPQGFAPQGFAQQGKAPQGLAQQGSHINRKHLKKGNIGSGRGSQGSSGKRNQDDRDGANFEHICKVATGYVMQALQTAPAPQGSHGEKPYVAPDEATERQKMIGNWECGNMRYRITKKECHMLQIEYRDKVIPKVIDKRGDWWSHMGYIRVRLVTENSIILSNWDKKDENWLPGIGLSRVERNRIRILGIHSSQVVI